MKFISYLEEKSNPNWKGCLMLTIPKADADAITEFGQRNIDTESLVDDGLEEYVHTTVLYGFSQKTNIAEVEEFVKNYADIFVTFGQIKRFEANENRPGSDVIVIEVDSLALRQMHEDLKEAFDVVTTYPTFNPHCTLAYVKPGAHKELDGDMTFEYMRSLCSEVVYSTGDSENRSQTKMTFEEFRNGRA
jgi:2'-5' RNA ligase